MRTSESISKLADALCKMQPELSVISKSGENKFDKYTYATLEDYIKGTREILSKHGFFLISSAVKLEQLPDRTTKNGSAEHAIQIDLTLRLIHQSGEWIETSCIGEGQDRADKAVYKAITGARKYAIASLLGLATSDDPEADEQVGQAQAPKPRERQAQHPDVERAVVDWLAKINKQEDIEGLKKVFSDAKDDLSSLANKEQLDRIAKAKDAKKAKLGLYAQTGVSH